MHGASCRSTRWQGLGQVKCTQIETAGKCTEHVSHVDQSQGRRAPIAEHLVKTAENSLKILQAWRRKFSCFKRSDRLKATGRALQTLIKPRDKEPLLDPVKKEEERPAKRLRLAEPAAPVIALPPDLMGDQAKGAAPPLPLPPLPDAGWGRGLGSRRAAVAAAVRRRAAVEGRRPRRAARPCSMRAV